MNALTEEDYIENEVEFLRKAGYRLTPKGAWVIEYVENQEAHPGATFIEACEEADRIWLDPHTMRDA
jgi:Fe2+ or Zn2+ uptake regulation protein